MKNEIHVEFIENVIRLILRLQQSLLRIDIEGLFLLLKHAFDNEKDSLDVILASEHTPQIAEHVRSRNSIYRGFSDTVKGLRNHFDPAVRADANRLWKIFLHYGNISKRQMDAETAAIDDIHREFARPENAEAIDRLQLNSWVSKLAQENETVRSTMDVRYSIRKGNTVYRMQTARVETDKYYRALVAHVENSVLTGKMAADDDFIWQLNASITRYKNILAQQFGMNNKPNTDDKPQPESNPADES
jgi:hypothetical protein